MCESLYVSLNENRPANLGEIKATGLGLEGKPPVIKWVQEVPNDKVNDNTKPHFAYDAEVVVPGKVKLLISTEYKIHWPAEDFCRLPVKVEVIIRRLAATLRIQYSNDKNRGSFL